jgi:hypothetical protein
MKSTMNMIRSASTSAYRQMAQQTTSCRRPPGRLGQTIRRLSKKHIATGGFLLAAPSFLVTPAESMIYDDDHTDSQSPTATLSNKSPLSSPNTSTLLASPESLKDSFDAFLQSIEPLICDTRMSVGISSIPHPAKVAKGGEDAYFLSDDMKVIGIADGMSTEMTTKHVFRCDSS